MAASMRLLSNTADSVIKRVSKLEIGNLSHIFATNQAQSLFNERKISTKNFDSFKYCLESVR